jgi:hypothetical protein
MTLSTRKSLWLRQTTCTVIAVGVTAIEIVSSPHGERDRPQSFSDRLADPFYSPVARAAFHIDQSQAESVIAGRVKSLWI